MKLHSHHVISIIAVVYRRTRRFILALLLIALLGQLWTSMQANSDKAMRQHSHELLQLTSEQVAWSARMPIITNDNDSLQGLVDHLLQHPYVLAASIRNNFGQLLVSNALHEQSTTSESHTVLVANIIDEGHNLGFLQLVIDNQQLLESSHKNHANARYFGQFLLVFAVLIGIFIAIIFNLRRYRLANNR